MYFLWLLPFVFAFGIYSYYRRKLDYWTRKGVPHPQPSIPFGNWSYKNKEYIGYSFKRRYEEFKAKGHKHFGLHFFTSAWYVPIDPEYIKGILVTDYPYFADRGIYYNKKSDPLSANLFHLDGERWKKARVKLTPTFSSGKIKMMFPIVLEVGRHLKKAVDECFRKREPMDALEVFSCFTNDVIGSCAFGVKCNSFENPTNEFRLQGKRIISDVSKSNSLSVLIPLVSVKLARLFDITVTSKDLTKFFVGLVKETIEFREKNSVNVKDAMQILIDQRDADNPCDRFTVEEIAAQIYIFYFAGFESSSSTMTFCLYELARHPHLQDKVKAEIAEVLSRYGSVTYEAINNFKYLDQVINETLRKYPPLSTLRRVCIKDYKIPGTDITIDKGTSVMIPTLGLHYDTDVYPNPNSFDPDRFSDESKKNRHSFMYLPFGAGPKTCLGIRFGFTQIKVGLALLLKEYQFRVNEKTKTPLEYETDKLFFVVKNNVLVDVNK
ncbi:hypothetical protein FQR65_LT12418 [Abscondita terminalis]|nr:hypothetical protein FQR65_LT12418 [Abscondita terminalis]